MNLREFFKKLRSPMGATILFLAAIVVLVLAIIPFLLRDDAGKLAVITRSESSEGSYEIPGTTKEINPQAGQHSRPGDKTGQIQSKESSGNSAPIPPKRPEVKRDSVSSRSDTSGSSANVPRRASGRSSAIMLIDGESEQSAEKAFVSDRYAPYGRLIACKMVNTVESGDTDTPLIAVVIEDLWWINSKGEKKLIIPSGTEVHGSINGAKPLRNRLTTGNRFILVWQATSDMVGFELQLNGIALEKSTYPDDRMLATISDMSAGIPGQVMSNENLSKFLMYTLAFGQGLAQGFQTNEVTTNSNSTIFTQEGTTKNAMARGAETMAQVMLQDISEQISKESYYIRVAAGTEFYLFVKQVINLDDAKVADTLLNQLEAEKIQGGQVSQQGSARNVLNAFSGKQK